MEKLLSFDQAANLTGWSYWEDRKPVEWGVITPQPKSAKGGQRLNSLYSQYKDLVKKYKPNTIVCEPPIGDDDDGKGHKTLFVLSQVMGLLEMIAAESLIPLELMPAARWQFNCGIHKRDRASRKQGAKDFIAKEYRISPDEISQDEADSLCIAHSFYTQKDRDDSKEECAF